MSSIWLFHSFHILVWILSKQAPLWSHHVLLFHNLIFMLIPFGFQVPTIMRIWISSQLFMQNQNITLTLTPLEIPNISGTAAITPQVKNHCSRFNGHTSATAPKFGTIQPGRYLGLGSVWTARGGPSEGPSLEVQQCALFTLYRRTNTRSMSIDRVDTWFSVWWWSVQSAIHLIMIKLACFTLTTVEETTWRWRRWWWFYSDSVTADPKLKHQIFHSSTSTSRRVPN